MKKITTALLIPLYCANAAAIDIDSYLASIQKAKAYTIEKAFALLPSSLRKNYTLMYEPHGLRGADHRSPQVIAFQPNGKFIVNVGSKNKLMGDQIEIIQFNDKTQEFELYSLKFPLNFNRKGEIIRPSKNPKECLECHGSNPNILWESYHNWPGAFGSGGHDDLSSTEVEYYKDFISFNGGNHPYNKLISPPGSEYGPYSLQGGKYWTYRPNTKLGIIVSHLNSLQMAKTITSSPYFEDLKYLYMTAIGSSTIMSSRDGKIACYHFLSSDKVRNAFVKYLKSQSTSIHKKILKDVEEKIKAYEEIASEEPRNSEAYRIAWRVYKNIIVDGLSELFGLNPRQISFEDGSGFPTFNSMDSLKGILRGELAKYLDSKGEKELLSLLGFKSWMDRFSRGEESDDDVIPTLHREGPKYSYFTGEKAYCEFSTSEALKELELKEY